MARKGLYSTSDKLGEYIESALRDLLAPQRGNAARIPLSRVRERAGLPPSLSPTLLLRFFSIGYTVTVDGKAWRLAGIERRYLEDTGRGTKKFKKIYLFFERA